MTSGELPIVRPMRRAARNVAAPVTSIVTNFCAPSPSRAICWARSTVTASSARRKLRSRRSSGTDDWLVRRLLGGAEQHRVAGRGVAVDGHAIERSVHRSREKRLQHRGGQCRIGEYIDKHRRHVGGDHAGPLGEPVEPYFDTVDCRPSPSLLSERCRWSGSRAPQPPSHRPSSRGTICGKAPMILSAGGGSPITPVEEMKISPRLATEQPRRRRRGAFQRPLCRLGR